MIENIIEFAIFSLYAFCLYVILYSKTKDFLNPFGIPVFSFIFIFAISRLRLNPLQSTLSFKTYLIVILVSMLIFFIGIVSINSIKTKQYPKKPENPEVTFRYKYAFRMVFFLTTICFFLTLFEVRFYDFLFLYSDVDDKKTIIDFESSIRIIRYFTNLNKTISLF